MKDKPKWKSFEDAVAQIQGLFTPNAQITRNARIKDRLGHTREFDVLIEDSWGGHELIAVIECKDLKGKVVTPQVEAFKEKSDKVRANFRAIVSRKGFSKPALEAAAHYGIGALSLLSHRTDVPGLAVYAPAYADVWSWGKAKLSVTTTGNFTLIPHISSPLLIKHQGKSVFGWFLEKLEARDRDYEQTGTWAFGLRFPRSETFTVNGQSFDVSQVTMFIEREHWRKTKQLRITGDAIYDWNEQRLTWPSRFTIETEEIDAAELSHWEDFEGEFPTGVSDAKVPFGLHGMVFSFHVCLPDLDEDAAELEGEFFATFPRGI